MALDVEIRVLVENHHHRGMTCHPGDLITVDPRRGQRLIAQGIGEKVGVIERENEATDEDAEEILDDDVEDIDEEHDEVGTAD